MHSLDNDKLDITNNNLKTSILRLKHEYLLMEHSTAYNYYRINVMLSAIFVSSFIFTFVAMFKLNQISLNAIIILILIILIVYIIIIWLTLYSAAWRRPTGWNQYYWSEMKGKK